MRPLLEGLTLQGFAARRLRIVLELCSPAHSAAVQSLGEAGLAKGASLGPYLKLIACPHFLSQFCFLLCANTNKGASLLPTAEPTAMRSSPGWTVASSDEPRQILPPSSCFLVCLWLEWQGNQLIQSLKMQQSLKAMPGVFQSALGLITIPMSLVETQYVCSGPPKR